MTENPIFLNDILMFLISILIFEVSIEAKIKDNQQLTHTGPVDLALQAVPVLVLALTDIHPG